jgi:hypothetical protein
MNRGSAFPVDPMGSTRKNDVSGLVFGRFPRLFWGFFPFGVEVSVRKK